MKVVVEGGGIVGDTNAMGYLGLQLLTSEQEIDFNFYLRSKNNPTIAKATPASRCHDGGSRKNKIPAMAMMAAPPAKIAGTEESGPPFWKRRKNAIVPAPTQIPVSTE